MRNKIIIFILLILAISGGLLFIYYKYEKSGNILDLEYTNVSLLATIKDKPIVTGYSISRDGYFYKNGTTLEDGYLLVSVPINSTYVFKSLNIENQSYYTVTKTILVKESISYRVDLKIIEPGIINISHTIDGNFINLTLKNTGIYNNISYCIDWSSNFLWTKSNTDTISNYQYFKKYPKCYETNKNLQDENYSIILEYKNWKAISSDDSINIIVFDKDIVDGQMIYKDFGGKDVEYVIAF